MCNPNGDPDENKPRLDDISKRLYVTEFRLKRTIRKYLHDVMGHNILLRQELDEKLEKEKGELGFKMLDGLASNYIFEIEGKTVNKKSGRTEKKMIKKIRQDDLLSDHIDIKLFGILLESIYNDSLLA